jgi:hypothetical protein
MRSARGEGLGREPFGLVAEEEAILADIPSKQEARARSAVPEDKESASNSGTSLRFPQVRLIANGHVADIDELITDREPGRQLYDVHTRRTRRHPSRGAWTGV